MKTLLTTLLVFFFSFSSVRGAEGISLPTVLVSVAPHKFFVEKIAGDTVHVELMVPAGASAHSYEPTPKQILRVSGADIWFQVGEFFEKRAGNALKSYRPEMTFVNLCTGLDLIHDADGMCAHCHSHGSADLHIWLSPRMAKIEAETICKALSAQLPQNKDLYQENLRQFQKELTALDEDISTQLSSLSNRTILVSHPAYAYFCRDYNLKQLSIEFEGKDPTPRQLTHLLQKAQDLNIRKIFIQPQYNNKGALLIGKEIGAKVVSLNPYAEDYFQSMREIAREFATL